MANGRNTQQLHALLELQNVQESIETLIRRQGELIGILNAIAFSSAHPDTVKQVMSTRDFINGNGGDSSLTAIGS